jgi:membrane associated rhomboid family serine protease
MLLLVMFGSHLERLWGAKRFFIFYMASGLGAFILYNSIGVWEIMELKKSIIAMGIDIDVLNHKIVNNYLSEITFSNERQGEIIQRYYDLTISNMVGASGALFGVLAGFAVLFPNTELMLLFPPIPIKAKFLIGAYLLFEIYSSIKMQHDQIAHLAHVGGAIVGISLVLIWRKTDKKNFW